MNTEEKQRLYYFDNLRFLIILLVVFFHSAFSYRKDLNSWAVIDNIQTDNIENIFFKMLIDMLNVFIMPSLFFIAGYFALQTLKQKGNIDFIKVKLKKLGIPFLIGIFFYIPFAPYIHYITRIKPEDVTISFNKFYLNYIQTISDFSISFFKTHYIFTPNYFWFISLLLIFFILLSLFYSYKNKFFSKQKDSSSYNIIKILIIFTIINFFGYFISFQFMQIWDWVRIGPFILFKPVKLTLYISIFILGIHAYQNHWFNNKNAKSLFIQKKKILFFLFLALAFTDIYAWGGFGASKFESQYSRALISFTNPSLALVITLIMIAVSKSIWNSGDKISIVFARNSYNLYLLHMIIVVVLQFVLSKIEMIPVIIKFFIVSIGTLSISIIISEFIIKRIPKLTIIILLSLFISLIIIL